MSYGISNPLNPASDFHTEKYDELLISGISFYALPVRVPANTTLRRGLLLGIDNNVYFGLSNPDLTGANAVYAVLMQDLTNNDPTNPINVTAQVAVGHFNFDKLFALDSSNQCVPVTSALLTDAEIANLAVRNIVIHKGFK
jgi:hypothetical protein